MADVDEPGEPPWAAFLAEVAETRRHFDQVEFRAVELVRSMGATWEDIGEALGMSRQAARSRFSRPRRRQRDDGTG